MKYLFGLTHFPDAAQGRRWWSQINDDVGVRCSCEVEMNFIFSNIQYALKVQIKEYQFTHSVRTLWVWVTQPYLTFNTTVFVFAGFSYSEWWCWIFASFCRSTYRICDIPWSIISWLARLIFVLVHIVLRLRSISHPCTEFSYRPSTWRSSTQCHQSFNVVLGAEVSWHPANF